MKNVIDGSELAGSCEGEDIAALIDFVQSIRRSGRVMPVDALVLGACNVLERIEARYKSQHESSKPASFSVEIKTNAYVAAHGKQPRGYGNWGFCPADKYRADDYLQHVMWHTGKYSDAKRMAIAFFSGKASVVVVCS